MAPHSIESSAMATEIKSRKGQPPLAQPVSNQTAASAEGTRIVAEATRIPKLDQSKRLAGGNDVIRDRSAKTTLATPELRDGGG